MIDIEKLDLERLINQEDNLNWVWNKSFKQNIVDKINEMIDNINKK